MAKKPPVPAEREEGRLMGKASSKSTQPKRGASYGSHGGNRGGRSEEAKQPKRSSQAAGKDPDRGRNQ
jgi:hypothetical protein